jgi:flagellar motor component MotA
MSHTPRILLGLALGAGLCTAGIVLEGAQLGMLADAHSALLMLGGTFGYLLTAFPLATHRRAWRAPFGDGPFDARELAVARRYFAAMGDGAVMLGVIGTIFGVIHVLENLHKPETIGRGLAVAFLSALYGYLLRTFVAGALGDAVVSRIHRDGLPSSTTPIRASNDDTHAQERARAS